MKPEIELPATTQETAAAPPNWLGGLNPPQRLAVESVEGPVLVLAGAGTGKTKVLTARLAHIVRSGYAKPWQILAVTFTNKAAREMRSRVSHLLGGTAAEAGWLGTFHALAARILRENPEAVGLRPNFAILDSDDQQRLIRQLMEAEGVDDRRWPVRVVHGVISRWKDKALTPRMLTNEDTKNIADGKIAKIYETYQARLIELNAVDFGDILLHNINIFQNHIEFLQRMQRRWRYIMVDEYQDVNVSQYLWLRMLAQYHKNICCVGDDDQSIYGWRGAEVGNILRFEKDFPGSSIIRLEENYRSTGNILAAASGLIAHNKGRLGKNLWTSGTEGDPISVCTLWDGEEEAKWVSTEIETIAQRGDCAATVAILVRAGFQTREFEERFLHIGLPYRVAGGLRFYERQEIRDALAWLRLANSPSDDLAFERVINLPRRGIGPATLKDLRERARSNGVNLVMAAASMGVDVTVRPKLRQELRQLTSMIAGWNKDSLQIAPLELAQRVMEESGYAAMWRTDTSPEAPGRLENLQEMITALAKFENLNNFLEHVALVAETDTNEESGQVTLMTLHAAKGLEFDIVFLPGWEDGVFPNQRALEENGAAGLEEERRLAYVGLTRARRRAFISHVINRRIFGSFQLASPSCFLSELPAAAVMQETRHGPSARYLRNNNPIRPQHALEPAHKAHSPPLTRKAASYGLRPTVSTSTKNAPDSYHRDGRVFHQKFGHGTVLAVDGEQIKIRFDEGGIKQVISSFLSTSSSNS